MVRKQTNRRARGGHYSVGSHPEPAAALPREPSHPLPRGPEKMTTGQSEHQWGLEPVVVSFHLGVTGWVRKRATTVFLFCRRKGPRVMGGVICASSRYCQFSQMGLLSPWQCTTAPSRPLLIPGSWGVSEKQQGTGVFLCNNLRFPTYNLLDASLGLIY